MATTKKRRAPKQKRSTVTYETILEAAMLVANDLGHEGFNRFSTEKVAEKAGVSIGSLYQYFSDGKELLSEMLDRINKIDLALVQQVFQGKPNGSLKSKLTQAMSALIEKRFIPRLGLYRFVILNRAEIARPETNRPIQERIVQGLQDLLEQHPKDLHGHNSHHVAFIISRSFMNVMGSAIVLRPEYLKDKNFLELLNTWSATIPSGGNMGSQNSKKRKNKK